MRTVQLLQCLSPKEVEEVEFIVANKKRKSLQNLFGALKKNAGRKKLATREELYELSFGKKFQKKNDYLIRNELRLLNDILYEFLAMATFKEAIRKTPDTLSAWLAKGLYHRQINDLFKTDIDSFIKHSRSNYKPDNTAQLLHYKFLYLQNHQERSVKNLKARLELLDELEKEDLRYFKYRLRESESRKAFVKMELEKAVQSKDLSYEKTGVTDPLISADVPVDADDWFEEYLILKKQVYQTEGKAKREVLKRILEVGKQDSARVEFTLNAQIVTTMLLATELIFAEQFKEADLMLLNTLSLCETHKTPFPTSMLQNLIANKINLRAYEDGVTVYTKYEDKIKKGPAYTITTLFLCYCYLFLNKPDEAIAALPEKTLITKQERYMARIVYLIAFCIRGDYELADHESKNLLKTMSAHKEGYSHAQIEIVRLFDKYIEALMARKKTAFAKYIRETKSDFFREHLIGDLGLQWLSRELEKL